MRVKPWERRGFRLANGLRVLHVWHPHLDAGCAVTLTVPVGTRRVPFGSAAVIAAHLGDDPAPELGHSALHWTLPGDLRESLDRVAAACAAPPPDEAELDVLWAAVRRRADGVSSAPAVVAMNAAHAAAYPDDVTYYTPWPAPPHAPPRRLLDVVWRRLDPRIVHLVIATTAPPDEVETVVRAHRIAGRAPHRSRVRRGDRPVKLRAPGVAVHPRPVYAPDGGPGVLAGIAVPIRSSAAGEFLHPYLARVPVADGLHSSVWAHTAAASVWALWGVHSVRDGTGGSALLRLAASEFREIALLGLAPTAARHVAYSLECDLRRIGQSPELLARHVAGFQGNDAPPYPPLPPFNPRSFAKRLQRLALGVGTPRPFLAGAEGLDRAAANAVFAEFARDTVCKASDRYRRDSPHPVQRFRHPRREGDHSPG